MNNDLGFFALAQAKYDATKLKYPNANITTTGHSKGGAEAYMVGKKNNVKSYVFNAGSSPLDKFTQLGLQHTPENKSTKYYVDGDVVGMAGATMGASTDEVVPIHRNKWIADLGASLGLASVGASVGGAVGGVAGLAAGVGASVFGDLHGLHNFLPPEAFKETIDPADIVHKWIYP